MDEQHPAHHQPQHATPEHQHEAGLFTKKSLVYIPWILLILTLFAGWELRAYHLDYPVVGYHNWKEEHYLSEARNFADDGFFKHGFFVPAWDIPFVTEDLAGAHADTFPLISILGAFAFKLFPDDLGAARGIGVVLNLASAIVFYFIIKRLFKREDLAILSAVIFALNPLMVFFSRNFQLDSPVLFMMLAGTWFLLEWIEKDRSRDFIMAAIFITLGVVSKYSFVVMCFPFFFIFPYRRLLEWRKRLWTFVPAIAIWSFLPIWFYYMEVYFKNKIKVMYNLIGGGAVISLTDIVNFTVVFTSEFWQSMRAYLADNFTILGVWIAVIGLVLLFVMRKRYPLGARYMLGYAGFGIFAFVILAYKLSGHSYHQFPYAPLVVFLIAFAFLVVSSTLAQLIKRPWTKYVFIALLLFALWNGVSSWGGGIPDAIDRQYATLFPGLDVAGKFIKGESESWERVIHSSHQSYGVLWHADRKGYKLSDNLKDVIAAENANATWIFVYQWRFNIFQNEAVMEHIKANYQLRQVGFAIKSGQFAPYYFLFQKGGTYEDTNLHDQLTGKPFETVLYESPMGVFDFYVSTLARQSGVSNTSQAELVE